MTDAVHVGAKHQEHERCAFCHDGFADESGKGMIRAECATCGAPHHAECFVENARCAVMACNGTDIRRLGGLEERIPLPDLARRIGAQVDVPIPPGVRLEQLRRVRRAAIMTVVFVVVTLVLGFVSTREWGKAFAFLPLLPLAGVVFAAVYGVLHLRRPEIRSEERTGPPCPRCGEALQVAGDGTTFCYRCDGGTSES